MNNTENEEREWVHGPVTLPMALAPHLAPWPARPALRRALLWSTLFSVGTGGVVSRENERSATTSRQLSSSPEPTPSSWWTVTSGHQYCEVTSDGLCVTDGAGSHGHNEACTMRAEVTLTLQVRGMS